MQIVLDKMSTFGCGAGAGFAGVAGVTGYFITN